MWSFLVILYVVLVQNCHSFGLHYDQPQPAQYAPTIPKSGRYQCTCTDGLTTKIIPINENDDRVGFITNYFTQPSMKFIQKPFEQNPMGAMYPNIPDFGPNIHYLKEPVNMGVTMKQNQGLFGLGFGQGVPNSDCLNSAFGKFNYGTSPCMNMMKYVYPGMSSSMVQVPGLPMSYPGQYQQEIKSQIQLQPGMFGGNVRQIGGYPGFNGNTNLNTNTNWMNGNLNGPYNGMFGMNGGFQVPRLSVVGQMMQPNPTTAYVNFKSSLPGANGEAGSSSEKNDAEGGTNASPSETESTK